MSIILAFLPIVIIGALIIGVVKLASRIRIWTPKRTSWVILIYFILGVISFVGILVMQDKTMKQLSEQQLEIALAEEQQLDELFETKRFDLISANYFVSENSYEGTAENIEITSSVGSFNTRIAVTWNNSESNNITATYYETPIIFERMDISEDMPPLKVEFENNHFYITEEEMQLDFASIQANFEMLKPHYFESARYGSLDGFIGKRILHLNVPKHFNIIDNSGRVN